MDNNKDCAGGEKCPPDEGDAWNFRLSFLTRSYAALRAADLDWIVRPGYSLGRVHSGEKPWKTNMEPWKTMETNQKPWKTMETNQKPWKTLKLRDVTHTGSQQNQI